MPKLPLLVHGFRGRKTIEDLLPKVKEHVVKEECPECQDKDLIVEYLCDQSSKDCLS
ncbi:MAG: hypothetical protein ACE5GQ_05080 [Nitrospinales bacterium]